MSVERKGSGSLRLACDGEWCAKKFSPQRSFTDPKQLRDHAIGYGWLTKPALAKQPSIPGVDGGGPAMDLCPECRRNPT